MWNDIQDSQLRLGSYNWLDIRREEGIRKWDTSLKAILVNLVLSVNELCARVPKEFPMWYAIQHSQLRLGSCNWLDMR